MTENGSIVLIVDDDQRVCEALCNLLSAKDLASVAFNSIGEYLAFSRPDIPACLILDVKLPDVSGLEFQEQIHHDEHQPPIVFITGYGSVPSSVRAIKDGAVDFLTKPFNDSELLRSIGAALERDREARQDRAELSILKGRLTSLTSREREVLPLVVSGLLNKQAAALLSISEVTLQIHRRRIMQKMEADSLPHLVRMADRLKIPATHTRRNGGGPP